MVERSENRRKSSQTTEMVTRENGNLILSPFPSIPPWQKFKSMLLKTPTKNYNDERISFGELAFSSRKT